MIECLKRALLSLGALEEFVFRDTNTNLGLFNKYSCGISRF